MRAERRRRWLTALVVSMAVLGAGVGAQAGPTDMVTGSVGTSFGLTNSTQLNSDAGQRFVSEIQLRGRFVQVLGLELTYNPAATGASNSALVFDSQFRLAGQIFFLPLDFMSAYLSFGVGANNMGELFSIAGDGNSYHAGVGTEFYVWDNLAVGAEWLMIVPGVRSIQKTVVTHALTAAFPGDDAAEPAVDVNNLSPWDFVNPKNFQLTVGVRYYF